MVLEEPERNERAATVPFGGAPWLLSIVALIALGAGGWTAPARADVVSAESERIADVTVYPEGRSLPASFPAQRDKWPSDMGYIGLQCLRNRGVHCDAILADLDGDGTDEIILTDTANYSGSYVFKIDDTGVWRIEGSIQLGLACPGVRDALRAGQFTVTPSRWKDLTIMGKTFRIGPPLPNASNCP